MLPSFKIHSFVVCDQVRREAGGKLFILGVYPGRQVSLKNIPGEAVLSFYIESKSETPGLYQGEFAIFDDENILQISQGISIRDTDTISTGAFISMVVFGVLRPQRYELRWRFSPTAQFQYVGDFFVAAIKLSNLLTE